MRVVPPSPPGGGRADGELGELEGLGVGEGASGEVEEAEGGAADEGQACRAQTCRHLGGGNNVNFQLQFFFNEKFLNEDVSKRLVCGGISAHTSGYANLQA